MNTMMKTGKIIVMDWGIFIHRAIFASRNNTAVHPTYTCLSMMLGNLKRIGVEEEDTIIVAVDFLKSWRKQYEEEYKSTRAQKRKDSGIDFPKLYKDFNNFEDELELSTDWHFIKIPHLEADDIMAVCSRYYNDKEVILVTYDSDLEQCWNYDNVKIFSPLSKKWKVKPPRFNPHLEIAKMVQKESSDDLVSPVLTEEHYNRRMVCVNLLELPEWVENSVIEQLEKIEPKVERLEYIPYPNSLGNRYETLKTDKTKIIDYDKQIEKTKKKLTRKKSKKKKEKIKNES